MYQHVLVAVDLSEESSLLLKKAASIAERHKAKLSLIHIDVNFSDLYTGLMDVNVDSMQESIDNENHQALVSLARQSPYPVSETLKGRGDLAQALTDAINQYNMDLLVVGHHQDFWSKIMSSTRQVMNSVSVDMLIVPLGKVV